MEAVLQDLQSQSRPTGDILNRSTVSAAAEELDRTSRQSIIIIIIIIYFYYYSTMALANKDDPTSNGVIYCYEVSVDLGALNRSRWRRE